MSAYGAVFGMYVYHIFYKRNVIITIVSYVFWEKKKKFGTILIARKFNF